MNRRLDRVLRGRRASRPPRAEIWIAPSVLASEELPNSPSGVAELAKRLGADLCFLSCSGPQAVTGDATQMRAAADRVHANGLACGALVDGPWQRLTDAEGLEPALRRLAAERDIDARIGALAQQAEQELSLWGKAGADMILLADDLAYNEGPLFSRSLFERLFLPRYRRFALAAPRGRPIGFHCDGNVTKLLPALLEAGFTFFSLEPEATRPSEVWQRHGQHVTLLSGIPAAWLATAVPPSELRSGLEELTGGGSLIMGSACGLFDPFCAERLKAIYCLADSSATSA